MSKLEIQSVSKRYGDFWALRDVSLEFDRGVGGLAADERLEQLLAWPGRGRQLRAVG